MNQPSGLPVAFPCACLPDEARACRLLGIYPQKQAGLWMQRVRIPGGRLSGPQWLALAAMARCFAPNAPLHLTTRQGLEFHDLSAEQVPAVQQALAEAGLTSVGSGGDTARNVTVCPCSGSAAGTPDLLPLAETLRIEVQAMDGAFALPRKFKVDFSCGPSCGRPWISDLGLRALRDKTGWRIEAVVAGSLGPRPGTGMRLFDELPPGHAAPLALALMRVFAELGDRQNRSRARLRHVRERLGDEAFTARVRAELEKVLGEKAWPDVRLAEAGSGLAGRLDLAFELGDLPADAAKAIGQLAARAGVFARIDCTQRVVLFGRSNEELAAFVAQFPALREAAAQRPAMVVCPGRPRCSRAVTDVRALAAALRPSGTRLPAGATLCVSGCPNGCAHSAVAEIGIVGSAAASEGKPDRFDLYRGGELGRGPKLAARVAEKLTAEEIISQL